MYGLPELFRDRVPGAKLVANPGCFATAAIMSCAADPGCRARRALARTRVDGKSGVSWAGRAAMASTSFVATRDSIRPYRFPAHQHTPEIERGVELATGHTVRALFVPHLVPTVRGVVQPSFLAAAEGVTTESLTRCLAAAYEREPFVRVLAAGEMVDAKRTRGTNVIELQAVADDRTGTLVVVGAVDNLVKGAAGQAIQNANLLIGAPEATALPPRRCTRELRRQRGVHDVTAADLPPQIRQRTVAKAHVLLEALPFMQRARRRVIVVKYGGAAMDARPRCFVRSGRRAALSAGIMPVVVHGGGPQVTKVSARLGIETTFVDGVRVTDAETLDVATMVLAGKLNTEVVASLVTGGVPAVGLSGVDGGLLLARRQEAPDLGFVGEVVHVDGGRTPHVRSGSCRWWRRSRSRVGQAYNVNADVVAAELAIALDAEKLVYLNDVPGLIGPTGDLLPSCPPSSASTLGRPGVIEGGMIPKLESAVDAIKAGIGVYTWSTAASSIRWCWSCSRPRAWEP